MRIKTVLRPDLILPAILIIKMVSPRVKCISTNKNKTNVTNVNQNRVLFHF
jgi:hypothetical protein